MIMDSERWTSFFTVQAKSDLMLPLSSKALDAHWRMKFLLLLPTLAFVAWIWGYVKDVVLQSTQNACEITN